MGVGGGDHQMDGLHQTTIRKSISLEVFVEEKGCEEEKTNDSIQRGKNHELEFVRLSHYIF